MSKRFSIIYSTIVDLEVPENFTKDDLVRAYIGAKYGPEYAFNEILRNMYFFEDNSIEVNFDVENGANQSLQNTSN